MISFLSRPIIGSVLKVFISALLLWGLIKYIDFNSVLTSFTHADPLFISIGLLLAFFQLVLHFFRWKYLLRLISHEITNSEVFTSLFVGFMAGFFTPAQLGEFAGRIASHPGVNKAHVIGITIIDKLYWTALTIIIGGTGLMIFYSTYFKEYWNPIFGYVGMFFIAAIIIVFLIPERIRTILQLLPKKVREHRFYEVILVIENEFHNKNARVLFGLTALLYSIIMIEFYFLAAAFGSVGFLDALICSASVFFVKAVILPISFGDLGVRESASVFFFLRVGVAAPVAFNASIVMSFANVIFPAAIGAVLVAKLKKS